MTIVQDRMAGMGYAEIASRHGVTAVTARRRCRRAVARGEVTAEQVGYKPHAKKHPHQPPYYRLYEKIVRRTKTDEGTGCWNWTGPSWKNRPHPGNRYGYIMVWDGVKYKTVGTHRAMMIALNGPLTPQQCVCHRCDNVLCVNPNHLFIGSMKENIWDSRRKLRHYESRRDHCERGHPLFGENLYKARNGSRHCKVCQTARGRIKSGWPKDLAFTIGKVPFGYKLDFQTLKFIPTKTRRTVSANDL